MTEDEPKNRSAALAMMIAGATVAGMMALTMPFVIMPASGKNLPYMATPAVKLKRALQFLQQRHIPTTTNRTSGNSNHSQRTFLDLGSGDGEAVYQAVQLMENNTNGKPYYAHCTGVELNSTLFLLSNIRRALFWTSDHRARSSFACRDFWKLPNETIRTADTILIFGIQPLMLPLSVKLAQTSSAGTHVLSYRFQLPVLDHARDADDRTATPSITEQSSSPLLLQAKLIYEEDEMRIYECAERRASNVATPQ
jgi:hypothetical protein